MSPVAVFQGGPGRAAGTPTRVGLQVPTGTVPRVGVGECVFVTTSPAITLRCRLGRTTAKLKGGVGGWKAVERPGRDDGLEWGSLPSRVLEIPLLLDGFAEGRTIDAEVNALYAMGRPPSGAPRGTPPPIIRVGGMVPHGDREWVLTDIAEDDAIWDGRHRLRLWCTVTLGVPGDLDLVKVTAKKASATPATRIYVVRAGDTLGTIARDQMGAKTSTAIAKGVAALKKLNGLRDAKAIRPGTKLKVPRG